VAKPFTDQEIIEFAWNNMIAREKRAKRKGKVVHLPITQDKGRHGPLKKTPERKMGR
jgi:hypothetical protein